MTHYLQVFAVFDYLQSPPVVSRTGTIVKDVTEVMKNFKQLTGRDLKDGSGKVVSLDTKFSEYMRKQFEDTEEWGQTWLRNAITLRTERQFSAKIQELKKLAADASKKESEKNVDKRNKYLKTIKSDRARLEKALKPLKTQLGALKTELDTQRKKIDDIQAKVFKETVVSKKRRIRSSGK